MMTGDSSACSAPSLVVVDGGHGAACRLYRGARPRRCLADLHVQGRRQPSSTLQNLPSTIICCQPPAEEACHRRDAVLDWGANRSFATRLGEHSRRGIRAGHGRAWALRSSDMELGGLQHALTLASSLKPCCTRLPAAPLSRRSRMVMRAAGSRRPSSTACWTRHRLTGCHEIDVLKPRNAEGSQIIHHHGGVF